MKYHERREFLREIEQLAGKSESAYHRKIGRMILQARSWMFGVLAGAVALIAVAVAAVRVDWIPVWLAGVVVVGGGWGFWRMARVMFFSMGLPHGYDIPRSSFPLLFKDLRDLRKKLGAPSFDEVYFTMEMGAGMLEQPRAFGLLPARNYLIVGFPLLHGVSREEFLAILAHELAHLSRKHSSLMRSAYRLRVQLARAHRELRQRAVRGHLLPNLSDFWERFELATRRLSRAHEFEADGIAARISPVRQTAVALCKAHVLGRFWDEELDEEIVRRMVRSDIPDIMPLQAFRRHLAGAGAAKRFAGILDQELLRKTSPEDTHPALAARLKALGEEASAEWALPESAAKAYFGRECEKIAEAFDKAWVTWIIPYWRARYESNQLTRAYGAQLRAVEKRGDKLSVGELWGIAAVQERLLNLPEAAKGYERFLAEFPGATDAKLALGRVLLKADALCAKTLLREVVMAHPLLWLQARNLLAQQLRNEGRLDELDQIEEIIDKTRGNGEEVFKERLELRRGDKLKPALVEKSLVDGLYNLAGHIGTIQRLWLLERTPKHFPEVRDFVLVFEPTGKAISDDLEEATQAVLAGEVYLPGTVLVVRASLSNLFLLWRAKDADGAEVFAKDD